MPGTKEGGLRAKATNQERHGKDFYAQIGAVGGSRRVKKGFACNTKLASIAGTVGGSISRRGKEVTSEEIAKIDQYYAEGMYPAAIAKRVGRSVNTVRRYLRGMTIHG